MIDLEYGVSTCVKTSILVSGNHNYIKMMEINRVKIRSSLTAILPRKCDNTNQNLINHVYIVVMQYK